MLRARFAYEIARGEDVEEACVKIYEESVRMVVDGGNIGPDVGRSSEVSSRRIFGNIGLLRRNSKTGSSITAALAGL